MQWFKHFVSFTKPTAENRVLLVLDGHFSHTKSIELIDLAAENHVVLICLPPHCTHRMQPLDVAFMIPFKTQYAQTVETWLRDHPDRMLNVYSIGEIFGVAYQKAATMKIAVEGFKATGLMPVDRHVFGDEDFLAETLDNADPLFASEKSFEIPPEEILPFPVLPSPASNSHQGKSFVVTTAAHRAELEAAAERKGNRQRLKPRQLSAPPDADGSSESENESLPDSSDEIENEEDDFITRLSDGEDEVEQAPSSSSRVLRSSSLKALEK